MRFLGNNNRGGAILTAMIAALSLGFVSAVIMQQSLVTEKQSKVPRIKSAMTTFESQLRESISSGRLFTACVPVTSDPNCRMVSPAVAASLTMILPGVQCPVGMSECGISLDATPVLAGNTVTARIIYQGVDIAIAPIEASITISDSDAWLSQNATCPLTTPLLKGFAANGNPICAALPGDCGPGRYVSAIDPNSLTGPGGVLCSDLPTNIQCPSGQFVSNFSWNGEANTVIQCQPFVNPFSDIALGDATSYEYASMSFTQSVWGTTTTTTLPPLCANPATSPVIQVSRRYCSNQINPFTGTNCTPIVPFASGGTYHSANTPNSNQSMTIFLTWNSGNYECQYDGYLGTSSSGGIPGVLNGGPIPGYSCGFVDWFNTSPGWGGPPGGMSGGLNILGPGPNYTTCP